MLHDRIANPLVILVEVDKIPDQVMTSSGSRLPRAFEVLKSMIEPTTARAWVCPFYQIPFNLTGVRWIITTNSIDRMPTAFLDRCKIIRLETPSFDHQASTGTRLLRDSLPEAQQALGDELQHEVLRGLGTRHDLRAVQLLLGHTKMDSTVRYLGGELEDAFAIAEAIEI
ncbi:hypothetical protein [Falsihalocynthiibacter arcticus]|uniref:ATPase AAA-type core domain-containing protein n=1 Tax=Falsihalocynthiibacter arcticus TaxID=1579316 RepID=A0A126V3V3_9RHOB|nr:hypothetical protein [Falsihalocynthiibacter arcticus]AML52998.1 hypothetical protein RC74_18600 [Falsihalocynthiibacter arcticus]